MRGGVHASQIVAFGGAVAAAKLLKLTDEHDGPRDRDLPRLAAGITA